MQTQVRATPHPQPTALGPAAPDHARVAEVRRAWLFLGVGLLALPAMAEQGRSSEKLYFWYTTCPKCAKVYGKNYVVLLAEQ